MTQVEPETPSERSQGAPQDDDRVGGGGAGFGTKVAVSITFMALIALFSVANNVVIARVSGTEGRGVYGLIMAIVGLSLPLASAGLGPAATHFLGRGASRAGVNTLGHLWAALALALSAIAGAGVYYFSERSGLGIPVSSTQLAIVAALFVLPAHVYNELQRGWYLGHHRAVAFNACNASVIGGVLLLNLITLSRGLHWLAFNLMISAWVVAFGLFLARLVRREIWRWPGQDFRARSFTYGLRASATGLADAGLMRVEYLVITPILGLSTVGVYGLADALAHLMSWAGLVAGKMMLAESSSDEVGDAAWAKLELSVRLLVAALGLASIIAAAIGWWILPLVFGEAFSDAYFALLLLLPASFAKSLNALCSTYLAGRGIQDPLVKAGWTALAADLALVLVLVHTLGWLGVAIAKSLAYLIQFALVARALKIACPDRRLGWRLRREDLAALRRWVDARRGRAT